MMQTNLFSIYISYLWSGIAVFPLDVEFLWLHICGSAVLEI